MEEIPVYEGKRKNIIIISGGGIKGFSALGCVKKLMENKIIVNPDIYCGTSVGGLISFLLLIDYTPQCIYDIISNIKYDNLVNFENFDIDCILEDDTYIGLNSTDPFITIIKTFMKKKNINYNITFKELYDITKKKLVLTGVCMNDMTLKYFSIDNTPEMEVLIALRITISIPIIFKPVIYKNKVWIDGGCMNNYPIDYFKDKLLDVIGIFIETEIDIIDNFEDALTYINRILSISLKTITSNKVDYYEKNTIRVKIPKKYCRWDINDIEKKEMFLIGYNAL